MEDNIRFMLRLILLSNNQTAPNATGIKAIIIALEPKAARKMPRPE